MDACSARSNPFLYEMVQTVRQLMGKAYPELTDASASRVPEIVLAEEKRFLQTLDIGLRKLEEELLLPGIRRNRPRWKTI